MFWQAEGAECQQPSSNSNERELFVNKLWDVNLGNFSISCFPGIANRKENFMTGKKKLQYCCTHSVLVNAVLVLCK